MNNTFKNTKNPFTVPNNYFDNLPSNIQNKLSDNSSEYSVLQKIILFAKPQLTLAFMIIAFASIAYITVSTFWNKFPIAPSETNEFANIDDINESDFTEQHYLNTLLEEKSATNKTEENTEEYIKYLVDDDIDYTTLMNELYYY